MKITIECEAKEIAALLGTERLGSKTEKIVVPIDLDITPIEKAQEMADKLKATLSEVRELIQKDLASCG